MNKRTVLFLILSLVVISANAIPARKGYWKKIPLADGTFVQAQLKGDENMHYWESEKGLYYQQSENAETFEAVSFNQLQKKARVRRENNRAANLLQTGARKVRETKYQGTRKGVIILAEFTDKSFVEGHDTTAFNKIFNERGYTEYPFKGSVKDYFLAQSNGAFELDFDVVGPVQLSRNSRYYAGSDGTQRGGEMVREACLQAEDMVNFADYDWDGDGVVEQVYVLYAGKGQHDGGGSSTVWPHEWSYDEDHAERVHVDSVEINVYSCGCELDGYGQLAGIGLMCHEYTHCFGIMDMYDTGNSGHFGMYNWDIMDYGCYNGNGYLPCGYTSYEKWWCGWIQPIELKSDTTITDMKGLSDHGETYVFYNDNCRDEYYLLENRQLTGWDASLDGDGMLIIHVDYDETIWKNNVINTTGSFYTSGGYTENFKNDHQRLTIFHADGSTGYSTMNVAGDAYPYDGNDSLTSFSSPAAKVYNLNTDGSYYMNKDVRNITRNDDGTISFDFVLLPVEEKKDSASCWFAETFNQCSGTGGNDGVFLGSVALGTFAPDNDGWTSSRKYGGFKCARFGYSGSVGDVTSPSFEMNGKATLSFDAAMFDSDGDTLEVYLGENLIDKVVMTNTNWTTYTYDISETGTTSLRFVPQGRFFLDDVYVEKVIDAAIVETEGRKQPRDSHIYGLDGRCLHTDWNALPHGIYIYQGKKIVK